jgi:hypothetical protein
VTSAQDGTSEAGRCIPEVPDQDRLGGQDRAADVYPNHHDGSWIRLTHHGFFVADVRSPEALESYFRLSDLEEALTARRFKLSYSNHAPSPSPSRSRTSQKIHRLVTGCLRATSSRYQPSTLAGLQLPSASSSSASVRLGSITVPVGGGSLLASIGRSALDEVGGG